METFAETRKRKLKDPYSGRKSNYGSETMLYLKNRAEQEIIFNKKNLN